VEDLTDNVNFMAAKPDHGRCAVSRSGVTAVANGDLKRKNWCSETKGEIAELADTINGMIDTLATFADQVNHRRARSGNRRQAGRAGACAGRGGNLARFNGQRQSARRQFDHASPRHRRSGDRRVTKGDLTRSIAVEALGEVAALKDNLNEMIVNLAATTRKNNEQDFLKTNIAKFTGMMQGQRDLLTLSQLLLSELTPLVGAQHGTFYIAESQESRTVLRLVAGYAIHDRDGVPMQFEVGQGWWGSAPRRRSASW